MTATNGNNLALVGGDDIRRSLHWVFKVGNLKESIEFYQKVFGLQILRHEEFESGCEATCNGPYQGAWSKTMVGYGPEEEHFAFELTYNYGISHYEMGNDLQFIALSCLGAKDRALELGYKVVAINETTNMIYGPDNYVYHVKEEKPNDTTIEAISMVGLRVSNLENAKNYYLNVLEMTLYNHSTDHTATTALVGYGKNQVKLHLMEFKDGITLNHGKANGRIAFATRQGVEPIYERVVSTKDTILTPPLVLPTPGKADVVVTILSDRDGYEICFVQEKGFYDLAKPTYDIIDWSARALRGADGNPLAKSAPLKYHETIQSLEGEQQYEDACNTNGIVLIQFTAGWCSKCKTILPDINNLCLQFPNISFYSLNIDDNEDLALDLNVATVPTFFIFDHGQKVGEYVGTDVKKLHLQLSNRLQQST